MLSVVNYKYDDNCVRDIENWAFGKNWPAVYIAYNENKAYVGETLDAVRRTKQHLAEDTFKDFSSICLISGRTFNKSVVLDLEAYLIKYIGAEGSKSLTNVNPGIVNHDYFYKEAYEEDFREVWKALTNLGIVSASITDVENSELFKYSPYKSLSNDQQTIAYEIIEKLCHINDATKQSLIEITGSAGTGKTILAVYLVKLLKDITDNRKVWLSVEDNEEALALEKLASKIAGIKKIGFVVPMAQLRTTMKAIFKSIDNLSEDMVISPEEVVKSYYDVLVVDEAHRLYRRKHLPGSHLYNKFDAINRTLMGEDFTASENDFTELDWIIKSSRMQVLFYDEYQTIRATDIGPERFSAICKPHLYYYAELLSQMRCHSGNGYYEYVRDIIENNGIMQLRYKPFKNYEFKIFDNINILKNVINSRNGVDKLCRMITGPGWGINDSIMIEDQRFQWGEDISHPLENDIFSIHKIQGFDLNYAGVVFGKELYYDRENHCIAINKKELRDNFTKSMGEEYMRRYIFNIYITLMTRGIYGTYVYAVDDALRDYLSEYIG